LFGFNFKKIVPIIKNQAVNLQTNGIMKPQRTYQFLVVFLLILSTKTFAQQQIPLFAQKIPHVQQTILKFQNEILYKPSFTVNKFQQKVVMINDPLQVIHPNLYTAQFGFFCRKEWEFEKHTYIPFKFRLGSLDYVNKMEGKENHNFVRQ
jgi:hypothetical protein